MSREEVAIIMSLLAHVIKIELHPVLIWLLNTACPVVVITTLKVLVIELEFKHSAQEDGASVSALSHSLNTFVVVNPRDLLRRNSRGSVQAEAVIPGLIFHVVILYAESKLEVLAQFCIFLVKTDLHVKLVCLTVALINVPVFKLQCIVGCIAQYGLKSVCHTCAVVLAFR